MSPYNIHLISYKIPNKNIPVEWVNSIKQWRDVNPNAIVKVWNNVELDNFVDNLSSEYRAVYDGLQYWIQKFDFIRLIILYEYGGMYSDLDIVPKVPFDFINNYNMPFFCSFRHNADQESTLYYNNSLFGSSAKHPLILELIERIIFNYNNKVGYTFKNKIFRVLYSTGPFMLSNVLMNTTHPYITLPRGLINSCHIDDPVPCTKEGSLVIHLKGRSWLDTSDKFFYCFFESANMKNAMIFLLILFFGLIIWISILL